MKKNFLAVALLFSLQFVKAQAPTVTSFTPIKGVVGTTVILTGTNFNTTAANNIVFFGATMATVTAATASSLSVIVPVSATYAPITVLNTGTGLAAYSLGNFTPTFSPPKTNITTSDFSPKVDFATGTTPWSVAIGDLDGDSKPDLAVINYVSNYISIYRNTSTNGIMSSGSFAAKVDFPTSNGPRTLAIGDLDGDGKPDLAVTNWSSNTVSIYRNTATSGIIGSGSFAAKVDFATGTNPNYIAISDLDGDGKLDLVITNESANTVSILKNSATNGSIGGGSFAAKVDFATSNSPISVAVGDLDGDGKPDLATANYISNNISVLRNTATIGSITTGSLATKVDFATGTNPFSVSISDLDGDSKPDLAATNWTSFTVSIYRNIATSGSISSSSFAAKVDFPTSNGPRTLAVGDLDGDGKPDLAVANINSNTISVYRNTSNNGSISSSSFAAKVDFTTGSNPYSVAIGDLDGDGKPDLIAPNQLPDLSSSNVSVFRNKDITLPSILNNFTVAKIINSAAIKFTTLTEVNSDFIEVQHSTNASNFTVLEKIIAKGNSTTTSSYSFTHNTPVNGINFYRLKLVDKDGKFSFSEIRKLDFKSANSEIIVYPNPIKKGILNIDLGETITKKEVFVLTTIDGKRVQQGIINNHQQSINISTLKAGTYLLKVGDRNTTKVIVE